MGFPLRDDAMIEEDKPTKRVGSMLQCAPIDHEMQLIRGKMPPSITPGNHARVMRLEFSQAQGSGL